MAGTVFKILAFVAAMLLAGATVAAAWDTIRRWL